MRLILLLLLLTSCGTKIIEDTRIIECSDIITDKDFILFNLYGCKIKGER